jgi:hypothetical protein
MATTSVPTATEELDFSDHGLALFVRDAFDADLRTRIDDAMDRRLAMLLTAPQHDLVAYADAA